MKKYALACAAALALLGVAGQRAPADWCFSMSCTHTCGCGCCFSMSCTHTCGCGCCSNCWSCPYYPVDLMPPGYCPDCGAGYPAGVPGYGAPAYPALGYAAPAAPSVTPAQPTPSQSFPPPPKPADTSSSSSLRPANRGYQPAGYPQYGYQAADFSPYTYPGYGYGTSGAPSYWYGQ